MRKRILPDIPYVKVPMNTQIQNLYKWNEEFSLGFFQRDFEKGRWPREPQDPWQVALVYFCLESPYETLKAWQRILGLDNTRPTLPEKAEDIRIQPNVSYQPGIHFCVVDLRAYWYRGYEESKDSPRSVVKQYPESAPHFAVLAAVAQLPEWRAHLGNPFPYVFIPGVQIKPPEKFWDSGPVYSLIVNVQIKRERAWERLINLDIVPEHSQWCETYAIPQLVSAPA